MTVYVDALFQATPRTAQARKHGSWWCHLWTDGDIEDLHVFAERIGLRRAWFQPSGPPRLAHYDLTPGKRTQAVQAGAVEKSLVQWMRERGG